MDIKRMMLIKYLKKKLDKAYSDGSNEITVSVKDVEKLYKELMANS